MSDPLIQAIILGLVQGIAEFLPISSSGHLVLMSRYLGFESDQVGMAIWLHLGTLGATCVVYYRDLWELVRSKWRRGLAIIVAMIPSGMIGILFKDEFDATFNSSGPGVVMAVGGFLILTALILFIGEQLFYRRDVTDEEVGFGAAIIIGLAQAVALFPGVSRSGMTIAAGLGCGVRREAAARFSFLLAVPTIAGAAFVEGFQTLGGESSQQTDWLPIVVGTSVAFVSGVIALKGLIAMIRRYPTYVFSIYCALLGASVLIGQLV